MKIAFLNLCHTDPELVARCARRLCADSDFDMYVHVDAKQDIEPFKKTLKDIRYGIEVIKTSYINENVDIEKRSIPEIIKDEIKINRILDKLKQNKVTPISAEYVIEDLLKESY